MSWILRTPDDPRNKYVRFAATKREEGWKEWNPLSLTGLIALARIEKNGRRLDSREKQIVKEAFQWFNEFVPCPPLLQMKEDGILTEDLISWWRLSAIEPIRKMRPLATILRSRGFVVRTLYSDRLSNIIYRDPYQVVARWPGRQ